MLDSDKKFLLMVAPMQGLTEAEFRHAHRLLTVSSETTAIYFTPFVRLENGAPRRRDMRDACSPLDPIGTAIPQIICRDADEMRKLTAALAEAGHRHIDINMGCPFAPQVKDGRGAALAVDPIRLSALCDCMAEWPGIRFSIKMRLGVEHPDEWRRSITAINAMPLTHITLHPRTAHAQYSGPLNFDQAAALMESTCHPVVFNGDIRHPDSIGPIINRLPLTRGVMVGRGMLQRPTLLDEWFTGRRVDVEEWRRSVLTLHDRMAEAYATRLCGNHQLLGKVLPMWEFMGAPFDSKAVKKIRKSKTWQQYELAVNALRTNRADDLL